MRKGAAERGEVVLGVLARLVGALALVALLLAALAGVELLAEHREVGQVLLVAALVSVAGCLLAALVSGVVLLAVRQRD
jgi:hypothetical protein